MSPECAFIQEKSHLVPLPDILPPVYEHYQRQVDSKGFVNLDTNRYSAPEKLVGKTLDVYKYPEEVRLVHQRQEIAIHPRLVGKRNDSSCLSGHHSKNNKKRTQQVSNKTEATLRGHDEVLDQYITALKKHVRGSGCRPLKRLLNLKRTYPQEALFKALKKASHYGLYDLNRVEDLIIKYVVGNYFNLEGEQL